MNAQVRQESNVVQVLIRYWDNVDKAVQIMQRFGDVRHVNVLNSERGLLEIVYYDVRAAQRAVEAKETMQCRLAAPCGNRKVRLPGTAALDESVVDKISDMYLDDAGGDFYTLVFFDTRDAEHYRMTALESNELLHSEWQEPWDDHHEPFRPYSGQSRLIEEEKSVASNQPWAPHALSSNARVGWWPWAEDGIMSSIAEEDENSEMNTFQPAPGTYTVLLQGIPLELLNRPCVDAILEQAGLANDVLQWQLKGKHMGICILMVVGQEGVCRCLNHFAGCRWGARASLISGNNIPGEPPTCYSRPTEEARRDVFDKSDWTVGCEYSIPARDYWLAEDQAISAVFPRAPKTFLKEGNFIPHAAKPTSEASTELSESDDEITKLQGRAQHLWYQPSGAC